MKRAEKKLNLPTIRRLPAYLEILKRLHGKGIDYVSTTLLIDELKFESVLVRKDLAGLGIAGKQKLGYRLTELSGAIEEYLGWNRNDEAFLIGAGALGSALLGYSKLEEYGFKIVAAFDSDKVKGGTEIHGKPVFHISKLPNLAKRMGIKIAVLTVPADSAQQVADVLVDSGIRGIWNFTGIELDLPEGVVSHNENITSGFALFSVKLRNLEEVAPQ